MSITFEDIVTVNETMKSIPVKGKGYVQVNERVKAFRRLFPMGTITTNIVSMENGVVTMQASVFDGELLLATGLAQEKEGASNINKTSHIENCETSAIGRALGFMALGIDDSIASTEELINAVINQQEEPERKHTKEERQQIQQTVEDSAKKRARLLELINEMDINAIQFAKQYGADHPNNIAPEKLSMAIGRLEKAKNGEQNKAS